MLPAYATKCYQCTTLSDQNCDKDNLEAEKYDFLVDCPGSFNKCMTVWTTKEDKEQIVNSCSNDALCKAAKEGCDKSDETCAVEGCDSDACNTANILPAKGKKRLFATHGIRVSTSIDA